MCNVHESPPFTSCCFFSLHFINCVCVCVYFSSVGSLSAEAAAVAGSSSVLSLIFHLLYSCSLYNMHLLYVMLIKVVCTHNTQVVQHKCANFHENYNQNGVIFLCVHFYMCVCICAKKCVQG